MMAGNLEALISVHGGCESTPAFVVWWNPQTADVAVTVIDGLPEIDLRMVADAVRKHAGYLFSEECVCRKSPQP